MNTVQLIVVAIGLIDIAVGRTISESYLDVELKMCGSQIFGMLERICDNHHYDRKAIDGPAANAQMKSFRNICCLNTCKVKEAILNFCPDKRMQSISGTNNAKSSPTTTVTTTKAPPSGAKVTTTTEKLASIWFLTG